MPWVKVDEEAVTPEVRSLLEEAGALFPPSGDEAALNRDRARATKDLSIVGPVRLRDGDACRFCRRIVEWRDRKSGRGAAYVHLTRIASKPQVSSIFVACKECAQLDESQLTLQPAPRGQTYSRITLDLLDRALPRRRVAAGLESRDGWSRVHHVSGLSLSDQRSYRHDEWQGPDLRAVLLILGNDTIVIDAYYSVPVGLEFGGRLVDDLALLVAEAIEGSHGLRHLTSGERDISVIRRLDPKVDVGGSEHEGQAKFLCLVHDRAHDVGGGHRDLMLVVTVHSDQGHSGSSSQGGGTGPGASPASPCLGLTTIEPRDASTRVRNPRTGSEFVRDEDGRSASLMGGSPVGEAGGSSADEPSYHLIEQVIRHLVVTGHLRSDDKAIAALRGKFGLSPEDDRRSPEAGS